MKISTGIFIQGIERLVTVTYAKPQIALCGRHVTVYLV